jgi:hypothetical protein
MPNPVNVVIPTKSNFTGLAQLLIDLTDDPVVGTICIVADGQAAFDALPDPPDHIIKILVPEGVGIQFMWNRKDNMEILDWQQLCFTLFKPTQLFDRLTLGAMPIPAGIILHLSSTTMRAGVYVPTQY